MIANACAFDQPDGLTALDVGLPGSAYTLAEIRTFNKGVRALLFMNTVSAKTPMVSARKVIETFSESVKLPDETEKVSSFLLA